MFKKKKKDQAPTCVKITPMADHSHLPASSQPPPPPLAHADGDSLTGSSTPAPVTAQALPSLLLQTARSGEQLHQHQHQLFSAAVAAPHYRYNASLRSVRSVASRVSLLDQFATTRKEFEFDFDDGSSFVALSVYSGEDGDGDGGVKVDVELGLEADGEEDEEYESEASEYGEDSEEEDIAGDGENVEQDNDIVEGEGEDELGKPGDAYEDQNEEVAENDAHDKRIKEQRNDALSMESQQTSKIPRTQPSLNLIRSSSSSSSNSGKRSTVSTRVKRTQAGKPSRRVRRKYHELLCLPEDNHSATDLQRAYSRLESILHSTDMPDEYSALAERYFEDVQRAFEGLMDRVHESGDGTGVQKSDDHPTDSSMSPNLASTCIRLLFWTAYVPALGLAAVENVLALTFSARPSSQSEATEKLRPNTANRSNPSANNPEANASNALATASSHRRRIEARRAEADNLVTLLAHPVRRRQRRERERDGLVILSAKYGIVASSSCKTTTPTPAAASPITANTASSFLFFGSDALSPPPSPDVVPPPPSFLGPEWAVPEEVADVTVAVAALVDGDEKEGRGSLYIPRGLRKSKLLGFWDPQPGRTKCLMVKYMYAGREGVELVMGREELRLPQVAVPDS